MKQSLYNLFIPSDNGDVIVYNTLSGAIVLVNGAVKEKIMAGRIQEIDDDNARRLRDCNIIVDDRVDEKKIFSYQYSKRIHSTDTVGFTLVTTYACNLKCPYCYEGAGTILNKEMDDETLDRVLWFVRHVASLAKCRNLEIGLFGGEPLLNKKACFRILDEMSEWTKEQDITFKSWIFTNGTLLTDPVIEKFSRYGTGVRLTLDGPREYHDRTRVFKDGSGTYDLLMDLIPKLAGSGINTAVRIQVANDNWREFGRLFDDLKMRGFFDNPKIRFGVSSIMALTNVCRNYSSLCLQQNESPGVYAEILKMASEKGLFLAEKPVPTTQKMFCGFLTDYFYAIDPYGDGYKCISLLGQQDHKIFSISEDGISEPTFEFFDFMSRDPLKFPQCNDCVYLPVCSGGCPIIAKKASGTYHAGDCSLHKKTVEEQVLEIYRMRVRSSKECSCGGDGVHIHGTSCK